MNKQKIFTNSIGILLICSIFIVSGCGKQDQNQDDTQPVANSPEKPIANAQEQPAVNAPEQSDLIELQHPAANPSEQPSVNPPEQPVGRAPESPLPPMLENQAPAQPTNATAAHLEFIPSAAFEIVSDYRKAWQGQGLPVPVQVVSWRLLEVKVRYHDAQRGHFFFDVAIDSAGEGPRSHISNVETAFGEGIRSYPVGFTVPYMISASRGGYAHTFNLEMVLLASGGSRSFRQSLAPNTGSSNIFTRQSPYVSHWSQREFSNQRVSTRLLQLPNGHLAHVIVNELEGLERHQMAIYEALPR